MGDDSSGKFSRVSLTDQRPGMLITIRLATRSRAPLSTFPDS